MMYEINFKKAEENTPAEFDFVVVVAAAKLIIMTIYLFMDSVHSLTEPPKSLNGKS